MSRSRIGLVAVSAGTALWLVAPILVVIPMGFTNRRSFQFPPAGWSTRWYSNLISDPAWYSAVLNSVKIALIVTGVTTLLGTAAAFALVRGRFPGKSIVNALLMSPMIVPVVIVAIGVYAVFLRWKLTGSLSGFIIAHSTLALPFVVVPVSASLQTFDRQLEAAAASLGATRTATLRHVTLPLILPGILAGSIFAFAVSFDEVVVSLFLVSPTLRTLPVELYLSVTRDIDPTIAAASTLLLGVTIVTLFFGFILMSIWRRFPTG